MSNYSPPSRNPADNDTLAGLLRLALKKALQKTDDMLPAKVIAYNPATNMAQVQPLIVVVTTNNQIVPRAQVASIPVYQASGGGFILKFPIAPGDFGWIKANDRDISLFTQTNQQSPPNTFRLHDFADSLFFPQAAFDLVTIDGGDANNVVLQNYAGTVKISMSETGVSITAPTVINMMAPEINISASSKLSLHSAAQVSLDADGTGFVYTPSLITTYTNGVATASNPPNPPGPL